MQTHIVVPLDGSSFAETILPHATALARATSARVTLLRVIPPVTSLGLMGVELPENWFDEEMVWSRNYLAQVARHLTNEGGINVQTEVLEGDPATEIVTYAQKKHDVTLVAMTTHGLSGGHRWLLGSVAIKVLHELPTSLLLFNPHGKVHRPPGPISYKTILVPLDGTRVAEQALDEAKSIASHMKATLLLLSVMPVSSESAANDYLEREAEVLRKQALQVAIWENDGHPVEEIPQISMGLEHHAGLVVMISRGHGDRQQHLLRSISEKFLQHSEVPVLLSQVQEFISQEGEENYER
jgi:nucleotide-binding universal stress UspA family protein